MKASNYFSEMAGIIGGIGPEATAYFQGLLVKIGHETAKKDQEHVPYLLYNNPQIPDRTSHLVYGKENPLPELIHTGRILKNAGATFLAMLCNTSHAYAEDLEKLTGLPVVNMIDLTANYVNYAYGNNSKVGLLATDGTVMSNLYQNSFFEINPSIEVLTPSVRNQKKVMNAIYDIKSVSVNERNMNALQDAAQELLDRGANVIILGCTEIPLAFANEKLKFKYIDPMEVLAREIAAKTMLSKLAFPKKFWQFFLTQAK